MMKNSLKGLVVDSIYSVMLKLRAIVLFANFCGLSFAAAGETTPPTAVQLGFFENKVRPLLIDKCYRCHSAKAEEKCPFGKAA